MNRFIQIIAILFIIACVFFVGHIQLQTSKGSFESPKINKKEKRYAYQKINIRSGPGTNHKIVGNLNRGDMVEIDSTQNGWSIVYEYGNRKGYVFDKLLKNNPIPDFEIVSWNWLKDRDFGSKGSIIYNVEVRNNTNRYVDNVKVILTTYDKAGQIMTSDYTFVNGLAPGGKSSRKSYATYYGNEETANIRVVR